MTRPRRLRPPRKGRPKIVLQYRGRRYITADDARQIKRTVAASGFNALVVSQDWDVIR